MVKDEQLQGPLPSPARLEQGKYKLASRIPSLPRLGWITNDLAVWTNRANAQLFTFPATTLVITSSPPRAEIFELSVKGRREPLGRTPMNLVVRPGSPVVLEFVSTNGTDIHTNTFDIVTTGLSIRETIECLRELGADVVAAACIIDRSAGKTDVGVPLIALAEYEVPAYPPDRLPPELAAIPAVKPGSRNI